MSLEPSLPPPSWPMVLGFGSRSDGEPDGARRLQAAELARSRAIALALHPLMALATVLAMARAVPTSWLALWAAAVTAVSIFGAHGLRHGGGPYTMLLRCTVNCGLFGLLWAMPTALFSLWAGPREAVLLALIVPGMMAGTAMLMSAAPAGAALFMGLTGLGGTGLMLRLGTPAGALLAFAATAILITVALRHARALMQRRGLEVVVAEKQAVISLLLREFEDGADWLWQVDAAKALEAVSPRLARLLDRPADTLEGRPLLEVLAGETWGSGKVAGPLRDLAERLRLRESFVDLAVPVPIGGETRWWSLSATPRHDRTGRFTGFSGVGSDITDRRRAAEKVERMARFDTLTGLANRRRVMEALSAALVAAHGTQGRAAFMILDLDRFKQVNDTLGHPVGDMLLRQVAERLLDLCGDYATCGRLGGDEFAIVVPDARDTARMEALAQAIIAGLSAPYDIGEHRLFVGASVGSATAPRDGRSAETLVRNADLALYRAKDDGRGVHRRYEPQLSLRAEERRSIEIALRSALEKDEFRLVYQPIVTGETAAIIGFEAFLRWTHPELGDVPPERFVPIAEEARLMGQIGEWVIRTACRDAAGWPPAIRLALNLSAAQFDDPQLPATLIAALAASGLEAGRLELEVSEAVFLRPGVHAHAALDRIRATGVGVALADFGMGYASLGYMRGARFSSIKLDRSFVVGATHNAADSLAIIRAVVAMADGLGIAVTAEGTETEREYDLLRRLGCARAQGYLFGHPVPAADASTLVMSDRARRAA